MAVLKAFGDGWMEAINLVCISSSISEEVIHVAHVIFFICVLVDARWEGRCSGYVCSSCGYADTEMKRANLDKNRGLYRILLES